MRRLVSIGFLFLHLSLFTEFEEVLRLPILLHHFVEHHSQVPSITFLQFLAMHYKTDTAHDSTDMELPFKDCSNSVTTTAFALPEQKTFLSIALPALVPTFFSSNSSFVPSFGLNEIFQPPRV